MLGAAAAPEFPTHLGPMDKERRPPLLPSLIPPLQHSGQMLPPPEPATQGRQGVDNSGNTDELLDLGTNSTLPTPLTRVECQGQAGESVTPPLFAAKGDRCYLIGSNTCSHALGKGGGENGWRGQKNQEFGILGFELLRKKLVP